MTRNEGLDPAFPIPVVPGLPNGEVLYGFNGVTIRDYFAAKALPAIVIQSTNVWDPKAFAEMAYAIADVMIEERAKV